jgi:2-iminobutanoate/2-iminopropanoate deaminase
MKTGITMARRGLSFLPTAPVLCAVALVACVLLQACRPSDDDLRRLIREESGNAGKREALSSAAVIGPYSPAVRAGKFLFVSGQIALDPLTGQMRQENIGVETKQVLDNVMRVLLSSGYDSSDVVSATVYVRDMKNYVSINTVYAGYFREKEYPARVAVEVSALPKGANVEIAVIAYRDR